MSMVNVAIVVGRAGEAEIAGNYMSQAEGLLKEGVPGKCDHVPAAVLSGAVLGSSSRMTSVPPGYFSAR